MIYLVIATVVSFLVLLFLVIKQEKENPNTQSVQSNEWKDTFGGPVDWDQH